MLIRSFEVASSVALPLFSMYQLFCLGEVIVRDNVVAVIGAVVDAVIGVDVCEVVREDIAEDVSEGRR